METREAILALLRDGNPKVIAAQASGVSIDSFNRWVQKDSHFASLVREAESVAVVARLQNIQKAGDRGDWKADSWYLERTQREIFGSNETKSNALAVQINIHRDSDTETEDAQEEAEGASGPRGPQSGRHVHRRRLRGPPAARVRRGVLARRRPPGGRVRLQSGLGLRDYGYRRPA